MKPRQTGIKLVAQNRKARHDYFIEDTYEAGMVLQGTEVKSLRQGNCSLGQAFARPKGSEIWLFDMHIAPYAQGNIQNHEPTQPRKLLLHRREIGRVISQCTQRGYTLVPLRVYFKAGYAKVEIGLAHRRRTWDKRDKKQAQQHRKDTERELSRRARQKR